MPARTIYFSSNCYYHVYNRGSEKRTIFVNPRDYTKFLERVKDNAKKFSIDVLCYCLMSNHFHFLLRQISEISLARFMNAIQLGHAKFFNTKYERVGPLFQGRFKAKIVNSEEYLLQLSAYIHRNPIADLIDSGNRLDSRNLKKLLYDYPYSSYNEYLHRDEKGIARPDTILSYFSKTKPKLSYQSFVESFVPDMEALVPMLAAYE